jgi:ribose 5-phosphate isomerase A
MDASEKKRRAAAKAIELIEPGMVVGLGTGSTAAEFVRLLGAEVGNGLDIKAIPTSEVTAQLAREAGITLVDFDDYPEIDVTVDGADEIDDELRLIKGGGGALLREKIVASASEQVVIIADDAKRVTTLGKFPLPIEVVPFGLNATIEMIKVLAEDAGVRGKITLRKGADGEPFVTDAGHHIVDCAFDAIPDPDLLADQLPIAPGVVEHGLFIDLADVAIIAGDGGLTILEPSEEDDEA